MVDGMVEGRVDVLDIEREEAAVAGLVGAETGWQAVANAAGFYYAGLCQDRKGGRVCCG